MTIGRLDADRAGVRPGARPSWAGGGAARSYYRAGAVLERVPTKSLWIGGIDSQALSAQECGHAAMRTSARDCWFFLNS